jgi:hypothetical protein
LRHTTLINEFCWYAPPPLTQPYQGVIKTRKPSRIVRGIAGLAYGWTLPALLNFHRHNISMIGLGTRSSDSGARIQLQFYIWVKLTCHCYSELDARAWLGAHLIGGLTGSGAWWLVIRQDSVVVGCVIMCTKYRALLGHDANVCVRARLVDVVPRRVLTLDGFKMNLKSRMSLGNCTCLDSRIQLEIWYLCRVYILFLL